MEHTWTCFVCGRKWHTYCCAFYSNPEAEKRSHHEVAASLCSQCFATEMNPLGELYLKLHDKLFEAWGFKSKYTKEETKTLSDITYDLEGAFRESVLQGRPDKIKEEQDAWQKEHPGTIKWW